MTRFLLIRHATTDAVGKRLSGRSPGMSLNEEGRKQAQQLAQRLAAVPVAAVYSSALERAVQTADPVAKQHNVKTIVHPDFLEIDFGEWTGCGFEELAIQQQFQRFNSFRSCTRIPGGELMMEAQLRIINGLEKLFLQHRSEAIAVVTHSDLIKSAIAYYAGIHLDMFQRIEISPASVSIIEIGEETARILLVNDTGGIKM